MGAEESGELERLLVAVRQAVGPISGREGQNPLLSLKDLRALLDLQHKAAADRGEREERQAIRDKEEREALRKAEVDKENRRHLRIALYSCALVIVGLVAFFYWAADPAQKAEISKQTLTVVFGGVTGAVGYFFGNKDKAKKD